MAPVVAIFGPDENRKLNVNLNPAPAVSSCRLAGNGRHVVNHVVWWRRGGYGAGRAAQPRLGPRAGAQAPCRGGLPRTVQNARDPHLLVWRLVLVQLRQHLRVVRAHARLRLLDREERLWAANGRAALVRPRAQAPSPAAANAARACFLGPHRRYRPRGFGFQRNRSTFPPARLGSHPSLQTGG